VVAKWLGLKKPTFTGRSVIRGYIESIDSHEYGPKSMQFFGSGVQFGCRPCDDKTFYWYVTWAPSSQGKPFTLIWTPSQEKLCLEHCIQFFKAYY
jgi:hypothetical protein